MRLFAMRHVVVTMGSLWHHFSIWHSHAAMIVSGFIAVTVSMTCTF